MKFDRNEIICSIETLIQVVEDHEKILEKCNAEIQMWRKEYIHSKGFLPSEKEEEHKFTSYLMTTPLGIEDILEWEKELDGYRDIREKNK